MTVNSECNSSDTGPDTMRGKNRASFRRRGGGLYVMTFMIAVLVTSTGTAMLSMQMANRRLQTNLTVAKQAEISARSGLEWAMGKFYSDTSWRSSAVSGEETKLELNGTPNQEISMILSDATADFQDDDTQEATLTVSSVVDGSVYDFAATLEPRPHETLARAIYSRSEVWFVGGVATVMGPIHADRGYSVEDGVDTSDNASFTTLTDGSVFGSMPEVSFVAAVEALAGPGLAHYVARATPLSGDAGDPNKYTGVGVAGPLVTRGLPNAESIYLVDGGGSAVIFEDAYFKGTMIIVNTGGNDVIFQGGCRFEEGGTGLPLLLIATDSSSVYMEPDRPLDEDVLRSDLNLNGTPSEIIPSAFTGVIWTNAQLTVLGGVGTTFRGSIIANDLDILGGVVVDDDPDLADDLMHGFTDGRLHLRQGSIRELTP